jgi:ABC-type glycerol-3-phosphate transport system substrate-binding protein
MKRIIVLFLILVLAATGSFARPGEEKPKETYTLRLLLPGDMLPANEEGMALLNKVSVKEIGIAYGVEYVSWGDFDTKRALYMQSNEPIDGVLVFQPELSNWWKRKGFAALNPYVSPQKTPNLLKVIPLKVFQNMSIAGEYTNFPSVSEYYNFYGALTIRQDLRKQAGLDPITTLADLEKYFAYVKSKGLIPANLGGDSHWNFLYRALNTYVFFAGPDALQGGPAMLDPNTNKLSNWLDDPRFRQGVEVFRRWYVNGWQDPDVMSSKPLEELFLQGKLGAYQHQTVNAGALNISRGLSPDGLYAEAVVLNPQRKEYRNFWANNLICVPRTSKQPGALAKYLDWVYADRINRYAPLVYGVPGKDYELEGSFLKPPATPRSGDLYSQQWWFWQAPLQFEDKSWYPELRDYWRKVRDPNVPVVETPTIGFFMDLTPVETIATRLGEVWMNKGVPLMCGLFDPDDPVNGIAALKQAYKDAGVDAFIAEAQKQWDAYRKGI